MGGFSQGQLNGMVRVCRNQVAAAIGSLDPMGALEAAVEEVPVDFVRQTRGRFLGYYQKTVVGPGSMGRVAINVALCPDEDEIMKTLYHEFAHAICYWLYGSEADSHGPKWQSIMVRLGQLPSARCEKSP